MGRLIDADALIEEAKELHVDDFMLIMAMVAKQPTAYDPEKVVAGLEDIKEKPSGCFGIMCSECKYTQKCHEGEMDYKIAIDNAIDIVKRGGVE